MILHKILTLFNTKNERILDWILIAASTGLNLD